MLYNLTRLVFLINSYQYLFSQTFIYFLFFSLSNLETTLLWILFVIGSYFAYLVLESTMNRVIQGIGFELDLGQEFYLYLFCICHGSYKANIDCYSSFHILEQWVSNSLALCTFLQISSVSD